MHLILPNRAAVQVCFLQALPCNRSCGTDSGYNFFNCSFSSASFFVLHSRTCRVAERAHDPSWLNDSRLTRLIQIACQDELERPVCALVRVIPSLILVWLLQVAQRRKEASHALVASPAGGMRPVLNPVLCCGRLALVFVHTQQDT